MGKTTLIRAARAADLRVAVGRCTPSPASTWQPLATLAAELVEQGADPDADVLGAHGPVIRGLLRPATVPVTDGPHPITVAEALLRLWGTLPVPRRPVLVIDDLHWADAETLTAVEHVADRAAGVQLVLVLATRPEGAAWPRAERLVEGGIASRIELLALAEIDVRAVVADHAGTDREEVPDELMSLVAPAAGWPLLLREILDATDGATDGTRSTGTTTLDGLARERLRRLDDDSRAMVQRAALLVEPIDTRCWPGRATLPRMHWPLASMRRSTRGSSPSTAAQGT